MPFTRGFLTDDDLNDHFTKHVVVQRDITGVTTEAEYLELADNFCGGVMGADTVEHIRSTDNAVLRYNMATNEFGIVGSDGFIRTYYKPSAGERYFRRQCI